MSLRYFAQLPPTELGLSNLQLLGRIAALKGLADSGLPLAILPGAKPHADA